jgi:hypothetical protein
VQFSNDSELDLRRTFRGPYRRRPRVSSLLAWSRSDLQALYGPEAGAGIQTRGTSGQRGMGDGS